MKKIRFTEKSNGFCGCFSGTTGKQKAAIILPAFVVDRILQLVFKETRGYVKECRESRIDLDRHIRGMIREWTAG